jgi:hypothetical protein
MAAKVWSRTIHVVSGETPILRPQVRHGAACGGRRSFRATDMPVAPQYGHRVFTIRPSGE